jgi:hypothetical protein
MGWAPFMYRSYQPEAQQRATRISQDDWDKLHPIIEQLYMEEGLSVQRLAATMSEQYGFTAK